LQVRKPDAVGSGRRSLGLNHRSQLHPTLAADASNLYVCACSSVSPALD
jgi:hypothetical protein